MRASDSKFLLSEKYFHPIDSMVTCRNLDIIQEGYGMGKHDHHNTIYFNIWKVNKIPLTTHYKALGEPLPSFDGEHSVFIAPSELIERPWGFEDLVFDSSALAMEQSVLSEGIGLPLWRRHENRQCSECVGDEMSMEKNTAKTVMIEFD